MKLLRFHDMLGALLIAVAFAAAPASAAPYVDRMLGDVPAEQRALVTEPKPVQFLFTFTTNGSANPRAANFLRDRVLQEVRATGIFSELSETPVPGGAVLSITIDNFADTQAAASRGARAGLTLGLAGFKVTDGYMARIEFLPAEGAPVITRTLEHAIHSTIGRTSPPENADRARNQREALFTVVRHVVANGLNQIALDPSFPGGGPLNSAALDLASDSATSADSSVSAEASPSEPAPQR